jgi:uncharacterized membrane protein
MRGISLSKLSISQIYGLSGSVYQENLGKLLLPALIPTLLLVGVSVIFYVTTLPTLVIEDISQYYSFSSYQALITSLALVRYLHRRARGLRRAHALRLSGHLGHR